MYIFISNSCFQSDKIYLTPDTVKNNISWVQLLSNQEIRYDQLLKMHYTSQFSQALCPWIARQLPIVC